MSDALARAAVDGVNSAKARNEALLKRLRHLKFETEPEVVLERSGRPTMHFVDVGVKFVDVKDRLKRVHAAKRRALLKRRRKSPAATLLSQQASTDAGATAGAFV